MEIKKFEKFIYEEEETWLFVKNEGKQVEIYLFTDNDMRYNAKVIENDTKTVDNWNEAIKIYHSFSASEIEAEKTYYDFEDDDEDGFDAAVESARDWLYS